jgi:hypothetical protein
MAQVPQRFPAGGARMTRRNENVMNLLISTYDMYRISGFAERSMDKRSFLPSAGSA